MNIKFSMDLHVPYTGRLALSIALFSLLQPDTRVQAQVAGPAPAAQANATPAAGAPAAEALPATHGAAETSAQPAAGTPPASLPAAPAAQTAAPAPQAAPPPQAAATPGPQIELAPAAAPAQAGDRAASPAEAPGPASSEPAPAPAVERAPAPAATPPTSIGGYAELHYDIDRVSGPGSTQATIDLSRMVLFVGHRFDSRFRFYSEIEVEHAVASSDREGEVEIEQAYLDYLLFGRALGVRAGVVLVPMGIINKWHEPPVFHGVERPDVDTVIIPSTWREGGAGVFGEPTEGLRYELYLVGGLDPRGFDAEQSIREGRQEVALAHASGLAVTGRVEAEPMLGAVLGVSGYYGLAGPNATLYDAAGHALELDVPVWGLSADARIRHEGLEARAVAALFGVGETARLRQAYDTDGQPLGIDTGALSWGAYAEVAYDVLRPLVRSDQQLLPFVRLERYDTMAAIRGRARVVADDAYAITDLIMGLSYRPLPQAVFKLDFGLRNPDGTTPTSGRLDLGVGVMF